MKNFGNWLRKTGIVLGLISLVFFGFDFLVFSRLSPKMVNFEPITPVEEGLFNWVGMGLLVFLSFCLLFLFQMAFFLKKAKKITFTSFFLVAMGVLAMLFVLGDVALLSDIGKQYRHGLAQPEWQVLYLVMGFQLVTSFVFLFFLAFNFKEGSQIKQIRRDSNIFLMVQGVGVVCGLLGLVSSGLGFLYPRAWNLHIHTTISTVVLIIPYLLALGFWLMIKFQEKQRQWYDEKQLQDIGKGSFLTLAAGVFFMTGLFVTNYTNLKGVVNNLWWPLYLFFTLLIFSAANLFFGRQD